MKAFLNDKQLKDDLLIEVEKHRAADAIIPGVYSDVFGAVFRGCAVGCSIESLNRLRGKHFNVSDHSAYPELVGVPEWLARLQDTIFEGMPRERQTLWPGQFWNAIPVGVDLDKLKAPFLIFVLRSTLDTLDYQKFPNVKTAVDRVIELYETSGTEADFEAAANAAKAANAAAAKAADAADAAAAYAANAAYAAANVAYTAYAAANAAYAAAYAAANVAANVAYTAYVAAGADCLALFADKLLDLFREAK